MKRVASTLAVLSAFAVASAAHAGVTISPSSQPAGTTFTVFGNPAAGQVSATFSRNGIGAILSDTDLIQFTILQDGLGSGTLTSTAVALEAIGDLDFLSATFNNGFNNYGVTLSGTDGNEFGFLTLGPVPIFNGVLNTLSITYKSFGNGKYSGTLDFVPNAAVPEPTTWALAIIGFALVGFSMRRRRKEQVRVRYAF